MFLYGKKSSPFWCVRNRTVQFAPPYLVTAYRPLELLGEPIKTDFISDAREISMTSPKILTLRCFEEKIRFKTLLKEAKGKTRYPAIFCCFDSIKV